MKRARTRLLVVGIVACLAFVACKGGQDGGAAGAGGPGASGRPWHLGQPVIDSHVHVAPNLPALARTLEVFDRVGIGRFAVKSSGPVGTPRYQATMAMQKVLGDRMRVFVNIDWQGAGEPGWADRQVRLLEQAKQDGAVGVKVFKNLGLQVRGPNGKLISPDDPVLDPIFEACGRLGLIFAWHIADPVAFFKPATPDNERYEELQLAKAWQFDGPEYPSFNDLMTVQERRIAHDPKTTFLLIHMGNNAEDLGYVDRLLATHPNVYVDTSARVPEFGRHPADQVRAFFVKHQDRILFGSDFIVDGVGDMQLGSVSHTVPTVDDAVEFFTRHWKYFETDVRQMDHPTPIQGPWKVDAINLPAEVLKKIYVTNPERLIWSSPLPGAKAPAASPK
jgi:predicted TIM-barrel fold metal-dependent hydrolase